MKKNLIKKKKHIKKVGIKLIFFLILSISPGEVQLNTFSNLKNQFFTFNYSPTYNYYFYETSK